MRPEILLNASRERVNAQSLGVGHHPGRLWWLSKLLCPHLQVLMPHVSSPHPNTGETDQTKIKPMQIKQVADSFGMMNGLAENRLLSMDVTRRHLKQSVHRLFFFFFLSKDPSVIWGGDLFSFWLRSRCFCMRGTFEHGLFNWTHPNHIWRLPGGAKSLRRELCLFTIPQTPYTATLEALNALLFLGKWADTVVVREIIRSDAVLCLPPLCWCRSVFCLPCKAEEKWLPGVGQSRVQVQIPLCSNCAVDPTLCPPVSLSVCERHIVCAACTWAASHRAARGAPREPTAPGGSCAFYSPTLPCLLMSLTHAVCCFLTPPLAPLL